MHTPKISVVLPVYNVAAYLPAALASLAQQTERDLEIIAVNDGSTDNSLALLESAALKDPRITIITQANGGLSAARNTALAVARGRWIAFLDSDDWLSPDTLATWLAQAEAQEVQMLIGNGFRFQQTPDDRFATLCRKQLWGQVVDGPAWAIHAERVREWPHWVWLQLTRRDFIESLGVRFVPGMLHEDSPWTLQLVLAAQRIGFCEAPLYGYRRNPVSIVRSPSTTMLSRRASSHIDIVSLLDTLAEQHRQQPNLRRALLRYANKRGNHFRKLVWKLPRWSPVRRELMRDFVAAGGVRTMFKGGDCARNAAQALLCWLSARVPVL